MKTWVKVKYINCETGLGGEYTFFNWESFRDWSERVSVVNMFGRKLKLVSVRGCI